MESNQRPARFPFNILGSSFSLSSMSQLFSIDREEKGFPPEGGVNSNPAAVPYHAQPYTGLEQPQPPPSALPIDERERTSQSFQIRQSQNLIPADNKLLIFRSLTGIDHVPILQKDGFFAPRNAPNVGIYTRVVQAEQTAATRYYWFSLLINTCLAVQIVVAAALTALGAASGPHGAVTAFGAINTIMAGFLTYLRGSGLPHKEKNVEKSWGQIREHIEQREREFCLENCMLNVEDEIHHIERMYEEVRAQMEAGASESGGSRGLDALSSLRPKGSLLAQAKSAAHMGFDAVQGVVADNRGHSEHHLRDDLRNFGQRIQGARDQIRHTEEDIRDARDDIRHTEENLRSTEDQIRRAGNNLRDSELHVSMHAPSLSLSRETQT